MARTVTLDGVNYSIPETGDEDWGSVVTDFLEAVTLDTLQPSGGLFTLTAEVDFGATFGLKSAYFLSRSANAANAGALRLASTDEINWRNPANSSNYALELNNSSERLSFRGIDLVDLSSSQTLRGKTLSSATLVDATISGLSLSSLGALEVAGDTVLGNDEPNDIVTFNSRIATPLTPKSSSTDLGTNSDRWGDLYLENISASGTLTVDTLNANTVTFSNVSALSLSISGPLSASSVSAVSLSASGALSAGAASLSNVSAASISSAGPLTATAANFSSVVATNFSNVSAVSLSASGALSAGAANVSSLSAASVSSSGPLSATSANLSNISAVTLSASGNITGAGLNVSNASVASLSSAGPVQGTSATFSNVSAASLSASGALSAGAANLSSISAASLSASGALAAASASLSNVSAVTVSASGRIESASTVAAVTVDASSVSATKLSVNGSSSQLVTDGDFTYDAAQGSFLGRANGVVGPIGGGSGDDSWTMTDIGSNQIRFNEGDRIVNGIVYSTSGDIDTNSTVAAITNNAFTLLDSSNGMLYAASSSVRVFTFYDIIDGTFHGIGDSTESSDYTWDYRNESPDFDINLSRYVPLGYVDVTATSNPGSITYDITNWPVASWTTFNNVAAAESSQPWSPTNSNNTNATLSKTRTMRVGNSVKGHGRIDWSGSGSGSTIEISAPFAMSANTRAGSGGKACIGVATYSTTGSAGNQDNASVDYDTNNGTITFSADGDTLDGADFSSGGFLDFNFDYEIAEADGYNPISVAFPSVNNLTTIKYLSSNVTSDQTITDLTFTTEIGVGKVYDVDVFLNYLKDPSDTVLEFQIFDGDPSGSGTLIQEIKPRGDVDGSTLFISIPKIQFANGSLYVRAQSISGTTVIFGNGTREETYIAVTEIPQSGVGVLIENAQDGHGGILNYYNKEVVDASGSGNFTGGSFLVERINQAVTITCITELTHSSLAAPESANGLIPAWARPPATRSTMYTAGSSNNREVQSLSNGRIRFVYRNWSGAGTSETSTLGNFCLTYSVGTS